MKINSLAPALAITTAIASIGSTASVYAQSGAGWDAKFAKRFYIGGTGGNSRLEPDTAGTDFDVVDKSDRAGQGFIGVDFSRHWSIELQYADLGLAVLQNRETLEAVGIEYAETALSGVYYMWNDYGEDEYLDYDGLDRRAGFSLYARLGLGQMENEAIGNVEYTRENDIQLMGGLGIEYGIESGLAARLEHIRYDTDAEFSGLSLMYRLGGRKDDRMQRRVDTDLPVLPAPRPIGELPPPPVPEFQQIPQLPQSQELPQLPATEQPIAGDTDFDGVLNNLDKCPDTLMGTPVNSEGCEIFSGVVEGVNFVTGSDSLTEAARVALDDVIATMREFPSVRLSVQAHTDAQGDEADNLELSRKRAISVVRYLISQGISIDRLQARAYGESRPIADNSTKEGRLLNRRVEFQTVE